MHIAHAQQPKEKMRLFGHRSKGPSRVFGRAIGLPATTTRLAAKRSMLIYRVTYTWQWSDGSLLKLSLSYTSITFAFSLHRPRVLFLSASLRPSVYNAKTSSPYAETEQRERELTLTHYWWTESLTHKCLRQNAISPKAVESIWCSSQEKNYKRKREGEIGGGKIPT